MTSLLLTLNVIKKCIMHHRNSNINDIYSIDIAVLQLKNK